MKLFISWSKPTSRSIAGILRDWLPDVIQQIEPWISSEDIDKGARWATEIGEKLDQSNQGILCVTPENIREPWLNFEAGALAKSLDNARVRPVLFNVSPSDVTGPLTQFQATEASDHDDMLRLIVSLNQSCGDLALEARRLESAFERVWKTYLDRLGKIDTRPHRKTDSRSTDDVTREILLRVRDLQRLTEDTLHSPRREKPQLSLIEFADSKLAPIGSFAEHPRYGTGQVIRKLNGDTVLVSFPATKGNVEVPSAELNLIQFIKGEQIV
ncbi:toll/interleukin-1 receptor domain-containing protein [Actinocatenispora sera]|uniref:TIR domain-containing protein n=1 Tax=Actinocatenispora sera TaxID=390989 RepID=A0A810L5D9_9ACTN|nr:TIR domain-containing protein [Actinocatenispora sera]BCJ30115.1 hypothetical protein Asera_42230 [Actinocatenispora sera]